MKKPNPTVAALTYAEISTLVDKHGSLRNVAKAIGVPRTSLQDHYAALKQMQFVTRRSKDARIVPVRDHVQRFIVTSAQDSTPLHDGFWANLNAYAGHLNAEIVVSGFTYAKGLFEDHSKASGVYHHEIVPFMMDRRIHIGSGLMLCMEMNTLPTAVDPLSGFDSYSGDRWGIYPHPKVHLKSIPTAKGDPVKIIMTTGAVTTPNYIQKKAGIKAEFNHEIGAVLVELLPNDRFFCRHLLAEEDGSFEDLRVRVSNGVITPTDGVEGITWGDIHEENADEEINEACWGKRTVGYGDGDLVPMIDFLNPLYQFVHDLTDFKFRNHHNISDPHFRFKMHIRGTDTVEDSMRSAASFLCYIHRRNTQTVVVESNHDLAFNKWLKTADYRHDPVNGEFFLRSQLKVYEQIKAGNDSFQIFPWTLKQFADLDDVIFLSQDDSFLIAGGIECAMHGHVGANGMRASAEQFSKMGRRSNTAHTHSATIFNGNYCAGVTAKLDMGYNVGLSSWSHTHIVTYRNGKRALITMHEDGCYCADVWLDWQGQKF